VRRSVVELALVALLALPVGAYGLSVLLSHRIWVSPRRGEPFELIGSGANLMGLALVGVSVALFAGWCGLRTSHRGLGLGVAGLCLAIAGACLAMALSGH
jgi:hypothetical protein